MADCFKPGDRVLFVQGRGYCRGRVANVVGQKVSIAVESGKVFVRKAYRVMRERG